MDGLGLEGDVEVQGLRILHRTTVKGMQDFAPPFGLPLVLDLATLEESVVNRESGVLVQGEVGFQWDPHRELKNMADDWQSLYTEPIDMMWLK